MKVAGPVFRMMTQQILDRKEVFLGDPSYPQHNAAKRLDVILSGFCDIFATDVYHHQSCYIKFAINRPEVHTKDEDVFDDWFIDEIKEDVMSLFEYKIRTKIVRDKEAY